MTFPSLPTDNLYKFMALAGTIIVIVSIYFSYTKLTDTFDRIIDTEETQDLLLVKMQSLNERTDNFKQMIKSSIAWQAGKRKPDRSKLEINVSESEIKQLKRELEDSLDQLKLEAVRHGASINRLKELQKRSKMIAVVGGGLLVVGGIMGFMGFFLWYSKVQKPLDLMLQKEAAGSSTSVGDTDAGRNKEMTGAESKRDIDEESKRET